MIDKSTIDYSLYIVIDEDWIQGRNLRRLTEDVIEGGATLLQYRNKTGTGIQFYEHARLIHEIAKSKGVPLIVNDRVDIALAVDTEGVHVGQDDLPESVVRALIGPEKCLGLSISHVEELEAIKSADYLGVGALFQTESKPDAEYSGLPLLRQVRKHTDLPLVGIGGINHENAASVIHSGADGVAMISAILGATDPLDATRKIEKIIRDTKTARVEDRL